MSTKRRKCWFYDPDTKTCIIRVFGDGGPCRCNGNNYDRERDPCSGFYRQDPYTGLPTDKTIKNADVREIPIDRLIESPLNPRSTYDQAELNAMAADMKTRGQEQNLVVRPHPDIENHRYDFEIAFGSRRYRAAKIAKLDKLICYVKHMDDKEFLLSMSMENYWHVQLTPLEQAKSLKNLIDAGFKNNQLANFFSKSRAWVSNLQRLLLAPDKIKDMLKEDQLSHRHVIRLMPYVEYPIMDKITEAIEIAIDHEEYITSRHMEAIIQNTITHDNYTDDVVVLNLDTFPSSIPLGKDHVKGEVLDQYFDLAGCAECKDAFAIRDEQERDSRYCLNRRCWKDKANLAKQAHEKALEELTVEPETEQQPKTDADEGQTLKKEELRLKEEQRLRTLHEKDKKRKESEERDRVVQAFDDYLDSVTDDFTYLDGRDVDDPEIRIWKTVLYHDVRHHWRDAVKLAMRRWNPAIKTPEEATRTADKLQGADIVLAVLRILFYQTIAMHKTMNVTYAELKKHFPDAAAFYTKGPKKEQDEE